MTSTPTGVTPVLEGNDVFLVGQKLPSGGYDNRTVSYDVLKSELGVQIAQQKKGALPGKAGLMFPNDTLTYTDEGELGVNFDTTGFHLVEFLTKNTAISDVDPTAINSKPGGPDLDAVVGDYYLVTDTGVIVDASKWGLEPVDFEADDANKGTGYQSNNGEFTSAGFDSAPEINGNLVLTYTVVDGSCT